MNDGVTVSNSFFAGSVTGSSSNKGAVFGRASGAFSSVYYDAYLAGLSVCDAGSSSTCNAVNVGNSTPNYFKNNKTNAPLNSWNFSGVWKRTAEYPIFGVDPADPVNPPAAATTQAQPWTCPDSPPSSAPDLFQAITTKDSATLFFAPVTGTHTYFITYGYFAGDNRFGVELTNVPTDGVVSYTIHQLAPKTRYFFMVRGGNGCMPGSWSPALNTKTSSGGKTFFYKAQ